MIGMVKVVKFPARMFAPEFEKIVHDRARFSHEVVLTNHVLEQMNERDITRRQVISTLRKGGVLTVPKLDKRHGTYVARMGYTSAGVLIEVVCAIDPEGVQVVAITTY